MWFVKNNDKIIANFVEMKDAEHFAEWKREQLALKFSEKQINDYIQVHPVNEYGSKTLPGDVPMAETYPEYEKYRKELDHIITIGETE